jgi:hypothetical protein
MTRSVVEKVMPDKPQLKKRVLVFSLVDSAGLSPERREQITDKFAKLLADSPHLLVFQPTEEMETSQFAKAIKMGIAAPPKLIKKAQDLHMNALITWRLAPVDDMEKRTGIWPLRRSRLIYDVSLVVNVVDVSVGVLYMSRQESEKMSFPADEGEFRDQQEIIEEVLERNIPRVLKEQSSAVKKELAREPWSGRILSVEKNTLTINAGSDVGITPGQTFSVFAKGESIESGDGKTVSILGREIGAIKVTDVTADRSKAVPLNEAGFLAGQLIKLKR